MRLSSETPASVQRSVGKRISASVAPSRSNANPLTDPVLKSNPVMIDSGATLRSGEGIEACPQQENETLIAQMIAN